MTGMLWLPVNFWQKKRRRRRRGLNRSGIHSLVEKWIQRYKWDENILKTRVRTLRLSFLLIYGIHIQGDFLKPGEFCFLIAPKPNKLHSSIIAQKKQKLMGFYLIPVMTKSDHYFFAICSRVNLVSFTKLHKRWTFQQM